MSILSFLRRPRVLIGCVIALVLATVAIGVAFFDWNLARGWIARQVKERTGRELVIAGNLRVHLFSLNPRIRAEQVTLGNAAWGEAPHLLTAERLDFSISLRDLLHGRIVFPDVALVHASVALERDRDGRRNWILTSAEEKTAPSPQIRRLILEHGQLSIEDAVSATRVQLAIDTVSDPPYGVRFAARGQIRGIPFRADGAGGALLTLLDESTTYPLRVNGVLNNTKIALEGTVTGLATLAEVDLRLALAGRDLALLSDPLGISLPATAPYRLTGRLVREPPVWRYSDFRGTVGRSNLHGEFSVDPNTPRPTLNAKLVSTLLDIADLGGFVGAQPGKAVAPAPAGPEPAQKQRVLPGAPFDLGKLRRVDAHVTLSAARFLNRALPLDNLNVTLNLVDGVARLEPLAFGVAGGSIISSVTLDARDPKIVGQIDGAFRKLRIGKLVPGAGILASALGEIDGKVRLKGRGNSTAALLGASSGRIDLVSGGGEISNLLIELASLDLANGAWLMLTGDKNVRLICGVAAFNVNDGIMKSETLVVDTDDTYVGGQGEISLRDETLDVTLTPLPKHFSIAALRTPLRVTGTFGNPQFGVEKGRVAAKTGAAVLLGILNPLAAIVPLVETGPGKDADCANLVQSAGKTIALRGFKRKVSFPAAGSSP